MSRAHRILKTPITPVEKITSRDAAPAGRVCTTDDKIPVSLTSITFFNKSTLNEEQKVVQIAEMYKHSLQDKSLDYYGVTYADRRDESSIRLTTLEVPSAVNPKTVKPASSTPNDSSSSSSSAEPKPIKRLKPRETK